MVITDTPDNTKKRKKDGLDSTDNINTRGGDVCRTEASPSKISKLVHQLGSHSLGTPGSPSDPSSESSQDSDSDDSQELSVNSLKNAVSEDRHEGSLQSSVLITSSLQQAPIMDVLVEKPKTSDTGCDASPSNTSKFDASSSQSSQDTTQSGSQSYQQDDENSQKKNQWVLDLQGEKVFSKLLEVFSEENLPRKITYGGSSYNLTRVYNEFWETFYNSPSYSEGHQTKLPQTQLLTDIQLKSLAKIIKRGWVDWCYWPTKLYRPFLKSCLLGRVDSNLITVSPEMFIKFIEPSENALIQNQHNVDQNILDIFERYCAGIAISIGDDIKDSCKKAAEFMLQKMKHIVDIWSAELVSVMPMSTFNHLMDETYNAVILQNIDPNLFNRIVDMEDYTPPHQVWQTFFLGWPEDKIRYYGKLLQNMRFGEKCILCKDTTQPFNAKHFISVCDMSLKTTRLERHDAILRILEKNLRLAIEKQNDPYLSMGTDWKVVTMYGNEFYTWPIEDLGVSFDGVLYPHMLVYSTSPKKRVVIVEFSVSWEHWIPLEKEQKSSKYSYVKEKLEEAGFEVEYHVFALGSRGVLVPELYNLLEQIFGMNDSDISQTLQEISQEIIQVTYSQYKKLMET